VTEQEITRLRKSIRKQHNSQVKNTADRITFLKEGLSHFEEEEKYELCSLFVECIKQLEQIQKSKTKSGSDFEDKLFNASFKYTILANEYIAVIVDDVIESIDSLNDFDL
jgi:hypothetical protein